MTSRLLSGCRDESPTAQVCDGVLMLDSIPFEGANDACKLVEPHLMAGKLVERAREFVKAWSPPAPHHHRSKAAACHQLGWVQRGGKWECKLATRRPFTKALLPDFACLNGNDFFSFWDRELDDFYAALGANHAPITYQSRANHAPIT